MLFCHLENNRFQNNNYSYEIGVCLQAMLQHCYFRSQRLRNFRKKNYKKRHLAVLYFVVNWENFPLISNDTVH